MQRVSESTSILAKVLYTCSKEENKTVENLRVSEHRNNELADIK